MLSYMRENAGSWIIKVLFGIIVVVFIFFYGFSDMRKADNATTIAKVGNQKITLDQYQKAYRNTVEMYRSIYKGQFNEEMMEKLGLKQKVLEDLIGRQILLQEAESRSIRVTDEEIQQAIYRTPMFQQDGKFSPGMYQQALNFWGITAADFEHEKQQELMLRSLEGIITGSAKVSDQELRDLFRLQQEKVRLAYVLFDPDKVKDPVSVSDEEIKKFYDGNRETFREPEKARVSYIVFDPARYEKGVEVSQQELEQRYQEDSDDYVEPKKIKARQILLKTDARDAAKDNETRKKAETLIEKIKKGEDFEKLAKKASEDKATADKGGDLGYFKKGDLVKPLESAAFGLKAGEVSPPVKSPQGWHIIKVEDIKEQRTRPLDEVKDDVAAAIRKEKGQRALELDARRAFNRLFKSKNLEEFAKEADLKVQQTPYFVFGASPEDAPGKDLFSKEAFALETGDISSAFAIGQKYYIVRLDDKKPPQIAPLDDVKGKISAGLEKQKKAELAGAAAQKLLMDLTQGKQQWEAAAKKAGLEIKKTEVQAGGDYIQGLGQSKQIEEAAFSLTPDAPYGKTPYMTDSGAAIIRLEERVQPSDADFEKEKGRIGQQLLQTKKSELFEQYLQGLKAKANTWVDKKFSSAL